MMVAQAVRCVSWRWPKPGTNWTPSCSVCWRRVTWTGSVWMRKLGKPPQTPTIRTAPLHPLAKDTYVIKLFDRSVDLAQFSENTPLYPICRAWMRNSPSVRERECSPSSPLPPLPEDEEGSEVTNSKNRDVYKLPPPTPPGPPGDACRSRIPSPLQPEMQGTPDDEPSEPEPSPSTLIYRNMQRWKRIRQRWKEASHRNQLRYSESMKILREMYERQ
ncbi:protein lin-37 homolog isoform X3 [Callithrix jacchus]|uniref:protein lin-37 homolog isoform X3 n=1 Tax=Callithrix jacchus TaxID=9483 RepID=UPI00159E9880|nr:protein lin-37 homolog isoform X3 [Callithrix jacchus]